MRSWHRSRQVRFLETLRARSFEERFSWLQGSRTFLYCRSWCTCWSFGTCCRSCCLVFRILCCIGWEHQCKLSWRIFIVKLVRWLRGRYLLRNLFVLEFEYKRRLGLEFIRFSRSTRVNVCLLWWLLKCSSSIIEWQRFSLIGYMRFRIGFILQCVLILQRLLLREIFDML